MRIKTKSEKLYFDWLVDQVEGQDYRTLLEYLHSVGFYSILPNDDNRAADGEQLRNLFERETRFDVDQFLGIRCSLLEMLIALARRTVEDVVGEGTVLFWFWKMVRNVGYLNTDGPDKRTLTNNLLERRCSFNGGGGLFPLKHARRNQANLEMWYQLMDYLEEMED